MSNPYEAPNADTERQSVVPWMILSTVLLILIVGFGFMLFRANVAAEQARQEAIMQAEQAKLSALRARRAIEAVQSQIPKQSDPR